MRAMTDTLADVTARYTRRINQANRWFEILGAEPDSRHTVLSYDAPPEGVVAVQNDALDPGTSHQHREPE